MQKITTPQAKALGQRCEEALGDGFGESLIVKLEHGNLGCLHTSTKLPNEERLEYKPSGNEIGYMQQFIADPVAFVSNKLKEVIGGILTPEQNEVVSKYPKHFVD